MDAEGRRLYARFDESNEQYIAQRRTRFPFRITNAAIEDDQAVEDMLLLPRSLLRIDEAIAMDSQQLNQYQVGRENFTVREVMNARYHFVYLNPSDAPIEQSVVDEVYRQCRNVCIDVSEFARIHIHAAEIQKQIVDITGVPSQFDIVGPEWGMNL